MFDICGVFIDVFYGLLILYGENWDLPGAIFERICSCDFKEIPRWKLRILMELICNDRTFDQGIKRRSSSKYLEDFIQFAKIGYTDLKLLKSVQVSLKSFFRMSRTLTRILDWNLFHWENDLS